MLKTGADVVKNDGIYSKYFTEYAGMLFATDSNRIDIDIFNYIVLTFTV